MYLLMIKNQVIKIIINGNNFVENVEECQILDLKVDFIISFLF